MENTGIPSHWQGKLEVNSLTMSPSGLGTLVATGSGDSDRSLTIHEWILVTRDGGRHWAPIGGGVPQAETVAFADDIHGFGFGTELAATADGGAHWTPIPFNGGWVAQLAVAGESAWVVTESCGRGNVTCVPTLWSLPLGGHELTALPRQPHITVLANVQQLVHPDPTTAYLVTSDNHAGDAVLGLVVTSDGGRSWSHRELPCPASTSGPTLSATGADDLWLRCYVGHGGIHGWPFATAFFHSKDGAATWLREGAPETLFDTVVAVGDDTLWADMNGARGMTQSGTVDRSTDGGRTWTAVLPPPVEPTMRLSSVFTATGAQSAWYATVETEAAGEHAVMYRTTDAGAHWSRTMMGQ